jgi:hypothetical protein
MGIFFSALAASGRYGIRPRPPASAFPSSYIHNIPSKDDIDLDQSHLRQHAF